MVTCVNVTWITNSWVTSTIYVHVYANATLEKGMKSIFNLLCVFHMGKEPLHWSQGQFKKIKSIIHVTLFKGSQYFLTTIVLCHVLKVWQVWNKYYWKHFLPF